MEKKTVFGHWDTTFLTVNSVIIKLVFYFVNIFTLTSARGGFLCSVIISLLFLVVSLFYNKIYSRLKNTDFGYITESAFGKLFKKISYIAYAACFVVNTGMLLTFHTASLMNTLLPMSNVRILLIFILVTAFVVASMGFKTLIRIHGIFTPALILVMLVVCGAMFTKFDINNFFPLLGYGVGSILYGVLYTFSYFFEIIFMLFLMPGMAKAEERKKTVKLTCGFSVFMLIVTLAAYIGCVPFPANTNILSVFMFIANSLNFVSPIREILLVFMITYTVNVIIYTALNIYFSAHLYSHSFNIKSTKPVLFGITVLLSCSTIAVGNVDVSVDWYKHIQPVLWIVGIALPICVLWKGYRNEKK